MFEVFPKIERLGSQLFEITEKINGTNACVYVFKKENGELDLITQSRNRIITPDDDNFGFATFVYANKEEFIEKLGEGRFYGEWAGFGIATGYNLKEKVFVLFDTWSFPPERPLPIRTMVVPKLYSGKINWSKVNEAMEDLRTSGSKLSEGFMKPEGIVVRIGKMKFKQVFEAEEVAWTGKDPNYVSQKQSIVEKDFAHFLQPLRLQKFLGKEERLSIGYPSTFMEIVNGYIADLHSESTEEERKEIDENLRALKNQVVGFIKWTFGQDALNSLATLGQEQGYDVPMIEYKDGCIWTCRHGSEKK